MSEGSVSKNPLYEIWHSFGRFSFAAKLVILLPLLFALVVLTTAVQTDERTNYEAEAAPKTQTYSESIYFNPISSTMRRGQNLSVALKINTLKRINAAELVINYPSNAVEIQSVVINNQAFDVTVTNNFGGGSIHLVVGSTKPLTGDVTIATINMKALTSKTQAKLIFGAPVTVLSFDTNLNIPITTVNGRYNIR